MINKEGLNKHRDKIFNDILEMLKTNRRVGCVQPTGIGKSYCIARLCNKLKGKKLVLEPGTEVINYMQKFNIETPGTDYITYHSLLRPSATDLANMFKEYDYIFLDEMHRALAEKWGKQLEKTFAILDVLEAKYKILGFSATPTRMDNRDAVEEIFHGVQIEPYYLQDAILDGILPNIEYHSSIYEITDKDKNKLKLKNTPLAKQILSYDIDEGVSKIFRENLDLSQPHHIIVFVDRIANIPEAIENMKKWLKTNFNTYTAHSMMSYQEGKKAIEDFQKDKNLSLMFAVDILNEGVHLDKVDVTIFLRKTGSTRIYNQQLGRVVSDTIENPKVFDLVNNIDNLENGYASIFKEKAKQLKIKTEQLITKNEEHLKITTHQEDLIEKLKYIIAFIRQDRYTIEERTFIINHPEMSIRQMRDNINTLFKTNRSMQSVRGFCQKNSYKYKNELKHITEKDKEYIKNHPELSNAKLSEILGIPTPTISSYRTKYVGIRRARNSLSREDKEFIKNNSSKYTLKQIKALGKIESNIEIIRRYCNRNNCSYIKENSIRELSEKQKDFINKNYGKLSINELAKKLKVPKIRVKEYIINTPSLYKIYSKRLNSISNEDLDFIKNNCNKYTKIEIIKKLNLNINSYYKLSKIQEKYNLQFKKNCKKFSKEELDFIKNNCNKMTNKELADELNRKSVHQVSKYAKIYRNNVTLSDRLTLKEKDFIEFHYHLQDMSQREIAEKLNLSYNTVMHYIRAYIRNKNR